MLKQVFLIFSLFCVLDAHAGVQLELEENGYQTTLQVEKNLIKLVGHPYKSELYYDTQKKLFYVVPGEGYSYTVATHQLDEYPTASIKKRSLAESRIYSKFEGRPWDLNVNGRTCGVVFTNQNLAKTIGVNLADIAAINLAIHHIYGANRPDECSAYKVPSALGNWAGFPLGFISHNGSESGLKKQFSLDLEFPKMSKWANALTNEAHVIILERELSEKNKGHYENILVQKNLPAHVQVETLKTMLAEQMQSRPLPKKEPEIIMKRQSVDLKRGVYTEGAEYQ